MEMQKRKQLAKEAIRVTLDYVATSGIQFKDKERFLQRFFHRLSERAKGSCGGTERGNPMVIIAMCNRHFDKAKEKTYWSNRNRPAKKVWGECYDNAMADKWLFVEYSHVHNTHDIGKFISDDPFHHILGTVTHEIAHAIQRWNDRLSVGKDSKPHGPEWQEYYRNLRNALLNPLLGSGCDIKLAAETGETIMAKKAGKKGAIKKKRTAKKTGTTTATGDFKVTKNVKSNPKRGAKVKSIFDIIFKARNGIKVSGVIKKSTHDAGYVKLCIKDGIDAGYLKVVK